MAHKWKAYYLLLRLIDLGWGPMPAPLATLGPRAAWYWAEGAEKFVPGTEPSLGLSCSSPGMEPQSPNEGPQSRAKTSLVHPKDNSPCSWNSSEKSWDLHLSRGGVVTSNLLPKDSPQIGMTAASAGQNPTVWDWWEAGQGRVKCNWEKTSFTRPGCPLSTHGNDPVLPPCGNFW